MQIDLDTLPDDPAILQQMLRAVVHQQSELHAENDKLRRLIQRLLRHQFGRRSEQLTGDQLQFGLEDLEQTIAENQAAQDAAAAGKYEPRRAARPDRNHGALPGHLPRYEVVIDVENHDCPLWRRPARDRRTAHRTLDITPAQLRVRVTRRPRYACRSCEGAVVVAPAPERPIDGGMATEALVVHVVVSKFCDSLPLYRQSQMLARQGLRWIAHAEQLGWGACWWLTPLYELVLNTVLSSSKLFADDTTLPVLDPGRGRTKTGHLWCYAVDERAWCGAAPPAAAYAYSEDRKNARPAEHLASFSGALEVDGYDGFKRLAGDRADASVRLAFCWAHMRRHFYEFYDSRNHRSPRTCSHASASSTRSKRRSGVIPLNTEGRCGGANRPIVEALHAWLQDHLGRVSAISDLAKAMRYTLRHWSGLVVFLDDGRVEMDTNVVERAIRPKTPTRKNALFAGSDGGARHWAIAMTLIQTAKLNGVDPTAWLTDVLQRIVSGRTKRTN